MGRVKGKASVYWPYEKEAQKPEGHVENLQEWT